MEVDVTERKSQRETTLHKSFLEDARVIIGYTYILSAAARWYFV
jgi:hypothetical protein